MTEDNIDFGTELVLFCEADGSEQARRVTPESYNWDGRLNTPVFNLPGWEVEEVIGNCPRYIAFRVRK
jgi:hypothetical protein